MVIYKTYKCYFIIMSFYFEKCEVFWPPCIFQIIFLYYIFNQGTVCVFRVFTCLFLASPIYVTHNHFSRITKKMLFYKLVLFNLHYVMPNIQIIMDTNEDHLVLRKIIQTSVLQQERLIIRLGSVRPYHLKYFRLMVHR